MLEKLSATKLVLLHNAVAEQPVKRFENTAKALQRTRKAIETSGYATHEALAKAGLVTDNKPPSALTSADSRAAADMSQTLPATPVVTAAQLVEKIGMAHELAELVVAFVRRQQVKGARATRSPGDPKPPSGKGALIVELCSRPEGATMKDLLLATAWPSLAAKTVCGKLAERAGLRFSFTARSKDHGPAVYRMSA